MSTPSTADVNSDLENTTSSPTKQVHQFAQAQFITTVNRDCGSSAAAANIDKIIEEEDEEEEEDKDDIKEEEAVKEDAIEIDLSKQIIAEEKQQTKFILETVVLDKEQNVIGPIETDLMPTTSSQPDASQPLLIGGLFTVNKINDKDILNAVSKEDINDAVEIRVEEGYATRQMDEYFRQTIAAIKEELTKKLNNEKKDQNTNQIKRNDEIDDFNSGEEAGSDYDGDDDYDDYYYDETDDVEKNKTKRINVKSPNFKLNNNQLYHHLINTNMGDNKDQSRFEQIAGWLVILGCILNQFIIDGLCFNYANIFDLIQKDFNINSRLMSSMPFALLICFYLLFAPVSIFLTKTYGSRRIALIGSFISTISLLISSYLTNIIAFTLFYGVFTGVGISLIYVPSLISISKWFLKKRLFANSITILGACLGAATYPLLSDYLIKKYTLAGALLVLSGIQFNCLVGSMFLREPSSPLSMFSKVKRQKKKSDPTNENLKPNELSLKKKSQMKKRSSSSTFLIEKDDKNKQMSQDIEMTTKSYNTTNENGKKHFKKATRSPYQHKIDSETESTTSTSTTTITNYTLKQYWRKFVQTRKSQANTKKNLFHLIAEEKKKTRTLSKTSLEDGFVITTSNNLLAPNDESHVIISSRQVKLLQAANNVQQQQPGTASSRTASRFFTRIANSIRSLGQSNNQSPLHTTAHSKNHIDSRNTPIESNELKVTNSQFHRVALSDKSTNDSPSNSKKNQEQQITPVAITPSPLIPLMSVFSGPLPETIQQNNPTLDLDSSNQIPPQLANVFSNESTGQANAPVLSDEDNDVDFNQNDFDDDNEDDDDYYEENELDDDKEIQAHKNQLRKVGNSNVYKMSRYLSYRNSLTNSVRGSLMECSVPEDREEQELASGGDVNSGVYDDDENDSTLTRNKTKRPTSQQRKRRLQRLQEANIKNNTLNQVKPSNETTKSKINNKFLTNGDNNTRNTTFRTTLISARRFISTIEGSSFFNLPFNLETVENNIKNSFILKYSSYYRRHQYQNKTPTYYNSDTKNTSTLFLLYLGYITNFKLFLNPLLMILNFAFFLNIIGVCVPLIYISEFCITQGITKTQSLYILALIGLTQGLGRVISTIIYKVNESNAKSRIFAHDLTIILAGLSVLLSTVLCDTLLSCSVFAIAFGLLFGFNANLRSLFIYDIIGLEWSDDSLFCCFSLAQAIGASIGIPIAGLIYDITKSYLNVFYFSGVCLILSGVILTPGRNFRTHCNGSIKRLNKYYFQKR